MAEKKRKKERKIIKRTYDPKQKYRLYYLKYKEKYGNKDTSETLVFMRIKQAREKYIELDNSQEYEIIESHQMILTEKEIMTLPWKNNRLPCVTRFNKA